MPAAVVRSTGAMLQLDGRAGATQRLTADDVADAGRLAREVNELRDKAAEQDRKHDPRWIDFEDIAVDATGATRIPLTHRFGARVRYWVVEWSGAAAPNLRKDATTTANRLVLTSTSAGTATIRVEEAG